MLEQISADTTECDCSLMQALYYVETLKCLDTKPVWKQWKFVEIPYSKGTKVVWMLLISANAHRCGGSISVLATT